MGKKKRKRLIENRRKVAKRVRRRDIAPVPFDPQEFANNLVLAKTDKKSGKEYVIVAGQKFSGDEAKFLKDYVQSLASKARRPFSLKYFNKGYDASDLREYDYEIRKAQYLSAPSTESILILINQLWIEAAFGVGQALCYGLSNSYKFKDLPEETPTRESEKFVFIHDDKYYLQAMLDTPKYFIEPWRVRKQDSFHTVETRRCLMRIGDEILLGEFTKDIQRTFNAVAPNAKSDYKFCVYYKGLENGKFIVDRWDYLPFSEHKNKFDEDGNFVKYGIKSDYTRLSHRHIGRLHGRLVMTQNQSADVSPTPINENNTSGEELTYESFEQMVEVADQTFNVQPGQITNYELHKHGLKKVGFMFCQKYDKKLHTEVRHEQIRKSFENIGRRTPEYVRAGVLPTLAEYFISEEDFSTTNYLKDAYDISSTNINVEIQDNYIMSPQNVASVDMECRRDVAETKDVSENVAPVQNDKPMEE